MSNLAWADELGRALARSDMEKNAYAKELASAAAHAGMEFAKTANPMLAGLGAKMVDFAKKNPGVAIGGGLGALHGLMKNDGGLGSALTEGAAGAGLGYGGQLAMQHPAAQATVDVAKDRVMNHPPVARFVSDVQARMKKQATPSADKIRKAMSSASSSRVGRFTDKVQGHLEKRLEKVHKGPDKAKHLSRAESLNNIKNDAEGAKALKDLKGPAAKRDNYTPPPKGKPTMRFDHKGRAEMVPEARGDGHPPKPKKGINDDHLVGGLVGGTVGYAGGAAIGVHAGRQDEREKQKRREQRQKSKEKNAAMSDEIGQIVEAEKVAFGAAIMGALSKAAPAAMNFIKSNPLKAGLGAASAVGNFASARKNGEGLGGALLSGAAGAASAL